MSLYYFLNIIWHISLPKSLKLQLIPLALICKSNLTMVIYWKCQNLKSSIRPKKGLCMCELFDTSMKLSTQIVILVALIFDIVPVQVWPLVTFTAIFVLRIQHFRVSLYSWGHKFTSWNMTLKFKSYSQKKCGFNLKSISAFISKLC